MSFNFVLNNCPIVLPFSFFQQFGLEILSSSFVLQSFPAVFSSSLVPQPCPAVLSCCPVQQSWPAVLSSRLVQQPSPAVLSSSLVQQSCPAVLSCNLVLQSCPSVLSPVLTCNLVLQCSPVMLSSFVLSCTWALILKHLVEAEKLTFPGELSFQRSESTAGLTVAAIFCVDCTDYLWKTSEGKYQIRSNDQPFLFYIENILRLIWKPCTHILSQLLFKNL